MPTMNSEFVQAMRDAMAPGVPLDNLRVLVSEPSTTEQQIGKRWTQCEAFRQGHADALPDTPGLRAYATQVARAIRLDEQQTQQQLDRLFTA
jgi:hypothetical protein